MTWDKPDAGDLRWLFSHARTGESPEYWYQEIATDFGERAAQLARERVPLEVEAKAAIEPPRQAWLAIRKETDARLEALIEELAD